jgi:hypothetical protein
MEMSKKIAVLNAQVESMLRVLTSTPQNKKTDHTTTALADNFNRLLESIKAECPEYADNLPLKIESSHPFSMLNKADATYLDLEMFLNQLSSILEIAASDG